MQTETQHSFSSTATEAPAPSRPQTTSGERGLDQVSMWLGLAALALIGVAAHQAAAGPWTLLAVPGAVLATFALLRAASVGPSSALFVSTRRRSPSSRPRSGGATRAWLVFGAVLTGVGAGVVIPA